MSISAGPLFTGVLAAIVFNSTLARAQVVKPASTREQLPIASSPLTADSGNDSSEAMIRFLERRIDRDPEDFVSYNSLAECYLQRLRETGDLIFFSLAARAANKSLTIVPVVRNPGALAALTRSEIADHEFIAAREHAIQLQSIASGDLPYALLADALLELGDYSGAIKALREVELRDKDDPETAQIRLARLDFLTGNISGAQQHFTKALSFIRSYARPPREAIAWCQWQSGEMLFAAGDYRGAEQDYRAALATFPNYFRALAGLARARAAESNWADAIEFYQRAIRRFPDPAFVAALGDLYQLSGRAKEANAQYALVEFIARLNELNGVVYNRQIALFYADHDRQPAKAYADASREYLVRKDIYGADAVAWTAFKTGDLTRARTAMREALRLGTRDARLYYHAGLIARASGDTRGMRNYLVKALRLNPAFDPLQSLKLRSALKEG